MTANQWVVWQLCDSAFPTGGFAHTGGLEAAWQAGWIPSPDALNRYICTQIQQTASSTGPLVAAVHRDPERFPELDALSDALLSNHVSNRASRAQGRAVARAAGAIFDVPPMPGGSESCAGDRSPLHLAPVFGAVCRRLDVTLDDAVRLYLFMAVRSFTSAAVRLGIVGPSHGQRLQHLMTPRMEELSRRALAIDVEDVASTAPLLDLAQGVQDRLYSRLFQS